MLQLGISEWGQGLAQREARKKRGRQAVRGSEGERMARKEEEESI